MIFLNALAFIFVQTLSDVLSKVFTREVNEVQRHVETRKGQIDVQGRSRTREKESLIEAFGHATSIPLESRRISSSSTLDNVTD